MARRKQGDYYKPEEIPLKEKEFERLRETQHDCYFCLIKSVGKPEQDEFVKWEIELNDKEMQLRNKFPPWHKYKLPIDPCPIETDSDCELCTMYFKKNEREGKYEKSFRQCNKSEDGAILCNSAPPMRLEKELFKWTQSELSRQD
jgi:hypothetical protein